MIERSQFTKKSEYLAHFFAYIDYVLTIVLKRVCGRRQAKESDMEQWEVDRRYSNGLALRRMGRAEEGKRRKISFKF